MQYVLYVSVIDVCIEYLKKRYLKKKVMINY